MTDAGRAILRESFLYESFEGPGEEAPGSQWHLPFNWSLRSSVLLVSSEGLPSRNAVVDKGSEILNDSFG